jgi:hypothetical protein
MSLGIILVLVIASFCGCIKKGENILLNSGFEEGENDHVSHWIQAIVPYENLSMHWDDVTYFNGSKCVGIKNTHIYNRTVANNWAQEIRKIPIGKTVELTGWIKTKDAEEVVMVIQCFDKNYNFTAFGTTETPDPITGTTDWTLYEASVKVPIKTRIIYVRLVLVGTGEVWFDDVKLTVK